MKASTQQIRPHKRQYDRARLTWEFQGGRKTQRVQTTSLEVDGEVTEDRWKWEDALQIHGATTMSCA
eukprot:772511-Pyramimonas_sp.AAC.1